MTLTLIGSSSGFSLQVLHNFQTNQPASLISASVGGFYGTSHGASNGPGSVFHATTSGQITTLAVFDQSRGTDPGGLIEGTDGNLYGITTFGQNGNGSVFRIDPEGSLSQLFVFGGSNGARPYGHLLQGSDGQLYGTTTSGGLNGYGTVFRLSPTGDSFTTLHNFDGVADGQQPLGGLIETAKGVIYGSTSLEGGESGGTLFRITHDGDFKTLVRFTHATGFGFVSLIPANDGTVYGTSAALFRNDRRVKWRRFS